MRLRLADLWTGCLITAAGSILGAILGWLQYDGLDVDL